MLSLSWPFQISSRFRRFIHEITKSRVVGRVRSPAKKGSISAGPMVQRTVLPPGAYVGVLWLVLSAFPHKDRRCGVLNGTVSELTVFFGVSWSTLVVILRRLLFTRRSSTSSYEILCIGIDIRLGGKVVGKVLDSNVCVFLTYLPFPCTTWGALPDDVETVSEADLGLPPCEGTHHNLCFI